MAERSGRSIRVIRGMETAQLDLDTRAYDSTDQHLAQLFYRSITMGEEPETSVWRNVSLHAHSSYGAMRPLDTTAETWCTGRRR